MKNQMKSLLVSLLTLVLLTNLAFAKKWNVNSSMTRLEIQAVIDSASDKDDIVFEDGIYYLSDAPILGNNYCGGALEIIDKTLTIKAAPGAAPILKGPQGQSRTLGATAFHVKDLSGQEDVIFDGLKFETFMRAISIWCPEYNGSPETQDLWNMRNITIKNCVFSEIYRQAIVISQNTGDIVIQDNQITTFLDGIFITWGINENENPSYQTDHSKVRIEKNTIEPDRRVGIYFHNTINATISDNMLQSQKFGTLGIASYGAKDKTTIKNNTINGTDWAIDIWNARGVKIHNNSILNGMFYGIYIEGDSSENEIEANDITMESGSMAAIYTDGYNNFFKDNVISGYGLYAFYLGWADYTWLGGTIQYAHQETIIKNDATGFLPDSCHFYLDEGTHNNYIKGTGDADVCYIDRGYNNTIIDISPCGGESASTVLTKERFSESKLKIIR